MVGFGGGELSFLGSVPGLEIEGNISLHLVKEWFPYLKFEIIVVLGEDTGIAARYLNF